MICFICVFVDMQRSPQTCSSAVNSRHIYRPWESKPQPNPATQAHCQVATNAHQVSSIVPAVTSQLMSPVVSPVLQAMSCQTTQISAQHMMPPVSTVPPASMDISTCHLVPPASMNISTCHLVPPASMNISTCHLVPPTSMEIYNYHMVPPAIMEIPTHHLVPRTSMEISTCHVVPPTSTSYMPTTRYELTQQHAVLEHELHQAPNFVASEYFQQINVIELRRWQALLRTDGVTNCRQAVHNYYDHLRLGLVLDVRAKLTSHSTTAATRNPAMVEAIRSDCSRKTSTPPPTACRNNGSGYYSKSSPEGITSSSTSNCPPEGKTKKPRKTLSSRANHVLEKWYQDNFNHPYPSDTVVKKLTAECDLTCAQVKKWMANKRVRSYNTLSYNGSVHPRKLKRLQRQHTALAHSAQRIAQRNALYQQLAPQYTPL